MTSQCYHFYKNFYDNSCDIRLMVINNPYNFKIVNFSNLFLSALGYTREELLALPSMRSIYHPDCYEALDQARALYLKQGFLNNCDLILKTKNGSKVFVLLDILAAKDKEGNILFNHCLYRNISDCGVENISKTAKEQQHLESLNEAFLQAQEFYQYFYDFYENAPDMLASISPGENLNSTRITHCNNTFAQKLGYSKEEILSMDIYDVYYPDCFSEVIKLKDYFLEHGYATNWELQFKKKNGEIIPVSLNAKAIKDKQGHIIGGIAMWRDITDLVETRRQVQETNALLIHQNEEIKTLMHIMSHDIQSPIRAIANFTQFILDEHKDALPPSALEFLYKLQLNTKRLHHLTQDVISFFFKGSLESVEDTNLKDITNQVLAYLDLPSLIKIHFKSDLKNFKTKKTLLAQIFYNLISNAIKYHHNPDAAEIYIEASDNNENLLFTIKDNGPGIAPKFHEIVFNPLQRLKSAKDVEGSGMGLAIVKKLITQEGGEINLKSEVGKGSTFTFTWPKHTQPN